MTAEERARYLKVEVDEEVKKLSAQVQSRARRAVNILRNSALEVLSGERHGRVYKLLGTHGKRANATTKALRGAYGHKLKGGQLYQASAPGEPPAVRKGNLRRNWRKYVLGGGSTASGVGMRIICRIKSDMPYSDLLDEGRERIKPRPYKDKVREMSMPQIDALYDNL